MNRTCSVWVAKLNFTHGLMHTIRTRIISAAMTLTRPTQLRQGRSARIRERRATWKWTGVGAYRMIDCRCAVQVTARRHTIVEHGVQSMLGKCNVSAGPSLVTRDRRNSTDRSHEARHLRGSLKLADGPNEFGFSQHRIAHRSSCQTVSLGLAGVDGYRRVSLLAQ